MASGFVPAYRIVKGDRVWIDVRFFEVNNIHEDANLGVTTFSFSDRKPLTVALGEKVVIK